jgi:hypothetical protein
MSKPICVITADCHIEELIWRDRPSLLGDAFHGFSQCVSLAVDKGLPLVLAGDIVETLPSKTPTSTTVAFLVKELDRVKHANLDVYNIYGQHDKAEPTWLRACDRWVTDADGRTIDIGGTMTSFLSWRDRESIKKMVQTIPSEAKILVAHQHWAELMGGSSPEISSKDVPHVSTIISGDYHRPARKSGENANGDPVSLFSPGATHMRKINEPPTHFALVLNDDGSVEPVKLNSRVVLKVDINSLDDLTSAMDTWAETLYEVMNEAAKRRLPITLHKPIYIVNDHIGVGSVYTKMKQIVGDTAFLFYQLKTTATSVDDVDSDVVFDGEESRLTYFLAKECGEASEEFGDLRNLLFSDDMKSAVRNLRDRFVKA